MKIHKKEVETDQGPGSQKWKSAIKKERDNKISSSDKPETREKYVRPDYLLRLL